MEEKSAVAAQGENLEDHIHPEQQDPNTRIQLEGRKSPSSPGRSVTRSARGASVSAAGALCLFKFVLSSNGEPDRARYQVVFFAVCDRRG